MIIKAKVKPNSKKFNIKLEEGMLKIDVPVNAEKGKANEYLIKKLRELFKCEVFLLRGHRSREKLLQIACNEAELKEVITNA